MELGVGVVKWIIKCSALRVYRGVIIWSIPWRKSNRTLRFVLRQWEPWSTLEYKQNAVQGLTRLRAPSGGLEENSLPGSGKNRRAPSPPPSNSPPLLQSYPYKAIHLPGQALPTWAVMSWCHLQPSIKISYPRVMSPMPGKRAMCSLISGSYPKGGYAFWSRVSSFNPNNPMRLYP